MDLMSDEVISAFGLLVSEAAERLVDSHDESLDKRAAMMNVEAPTVARLGLGLEFSFQIKANRQSPKSVTLLLGPESDGQEGFEEEDVVALPQFDALAATPQCSCPDFQRSERCSHTLAAAWWLQEQLARRSFSEVFDFIGELEVDEVAAGRELVSDLLGMAEDARKVHQQVDDTRLQWRLRLTNSRYHCAISISAYEQRPRKNGKGWTKGRQLRHDDLLERDFSQDPRDSQIAAVAANPSYSFNNDHFSEFQALLRLVGHPNVAWDDPQATPISVYSSELVLQLEPFEREEDPEQYDKHMAAEQSSADEDFETLFRPQLRVGGLSVDPFQCQMVFGYASPSEPLVVLVDQKHHRLVICTLRKAEAAELVQHLLEGGLDDVLLDAETASRFAVGCNRVDSLVRVELPSQLAGPIEPVSAELVIELKPRLGAGLHIAVAMHEDRFRELLVPGHVPEIVPCLTDSGPVRLQRDLQEEKQRADQVMDRFGLEKLSGDGQYQWVAETDEQALELLASLYNAGEEAPRLIWPEGESLRVRGEVTPSALRVQIDDGRDWFGLSGSITLDGREIPLADLLSAVRDNRSLVQVGDRQFARISEAFRQRLQQLGDSVVAERGKLKIAEAAVPAVEELIGTDVPLEATARWHESLERLHKLENWTPDKPEKLDATLRDYQLDGYRWLARLSAWGVGGVLADDMGLGKTVQTLGVLLDRGSDGPALVVAPTSVGDNWVRETERFAPTLKAHLYRDSDRDQLIKQAGPNDLVIVSYQLLQRDAKKFATQPWNTLVLDEAQFIKNSQTKTSQAVRQIEANWRLGLSGTPLENHLGELWSLFRTLSPGLLGSWDRFRNRFADPIERHKDEQRRQSLAALVRPFILRRTKDKVLQELPPRTEITLQAELSKTERRLYEEARLAALAELSNDGGDQDSAGQHRIRTLAWLTRLRQLACHPRLVDPSWNKSSAKLDLLMSLVEELREGDHRALIFSQFVKHLEVIRESLDRHGITYQYLDGSTPAKERQRRVDAFQNGEGDLFLISLKAGGTGLNLTAADYVIHLDPWWNPAVEDQATDRAHRIGQDRRVTVYRLVAEGTIEEQILELHADKRELVAGVLDGTDRAARMNTDELIKLIKEGAGH